MPVSCLRRTNNFRSVRFSLTFFFRLIRTKNRKAECAWSCAWTLTSGDSCSFLSDSSSSTYLPWFVGDRPGPASKYLRLPGCNRPSSANLKWCVGEKMGCVCVGVCCFIVFFSLFFAKAIRDIQSAGSGLDPDWKILWSSNLWFCCFFSFQLLEPTLGQFPSKYKTNTLSWGFQNFMW